MKIKLFRIVLIGLISIVVVCSIYLTSIWKDSEGSGFIRNIGHTKFVTATTLPGSISYFIGHEGDRLYLGGRSPDALHYYQSGSLSSGLSIKAPPNDTLHPVRMSILSGSLYLEDVVSSKFYRANLDDLQLYPISKSENLTAETIPISKTTFVVRILANGEFILALKAIDDGKISLFPHLLEKQVDGMFCTDGMLLYNKELNRLVYVYYYRNQFISMDTSMNVVVHGHTIDTLSRTHFKISRIASDGVITFSSPPKFVNVKSTTSGNYLYIQSGIRADNETRAEFSASTCVDVYDLQTATYLYSFYLPKYENHRVLDFIVEDTTAMVVYQNNLVRYHLTPP